MYPGILTNHSICSTHDPFAMAIDYVPGTSIYITNHHSRLLHTGERNSCVNFAIMRFQTIVTCELKFIAGVAFHHNGISVDMRLVSGEGMLTLSPNKLTNA